MVGMMSTMKRVMSLGATNLTSHLSVLNTTPKHATNDKTLTLFQIDATN